MKIKFSIIAFTFLIILLNGSESSLINSELWNKELIGAGHSYNFVNENELLLTTERGVITRLDLSRGSAVWKKNMIYQDIFELETIDQCKYIILFV